jgi:uncharacterized membrane protein
MAHTVHRASGVRLLFKPRPLWHHLKGTYWFVPSLMTLTAAALAMVLIGIDRRYPGAAGWLGWAYGGGAAGARSLLSAVAGSAITVVSVTFSVTVVALTVSAQHFGPRLLGNFMRDTAAQVVLGAFISTFTYCLLVLRTVQGEGDGYETFVPHLATTIAVVITLLSVGALIYYVHHVSISMQVSEIALGVSRDLERAIDRLYPDPIGEEREEAAAPRGRPAGALPLASADSGYVQAVDGDRLVKVAREHDLVIWVLARPGDFVVEGTALACASEPSADRHTLSRTVQAAFVIGPDRTSEQDAGFAIQQLVEVALRALSPGTNEPFTAVTCIDRLGQGLARLACRRIPDAERTDEDGRVRVIAEPQAFGSLLNAAFGPVARAAAAEPVVTERLLGALSNLDRIARRAGDRRAIAKQAAAILQVSSLDPDDPARGRIEESCRRVQSRADAAGSSETPRASSEPAIRRPRSC